MDKKTASCFVILFAAVSLGGCGGDGRTLVVVTVKGDRNGAALIRALLALPNKNESTEVEEYSGDVSDFALVTPSQFTGPFELAVSGNNDAGCIIAYVQTALDAGGQHEIDAPVSLHVVNPPCCAGQQCSL